MKETSLLGKIIVVGVGIVASVFGSWMSWKCNVEYDKMSAAQAKKKEDEAKRKAEKIDKTMVREIEKVLDAKAQWIVQSVAESEKNKQQRRSS